MIALAAVTIFARRSLSNLTYLPATELVEAVRAAAA